MCSCLYQCARACVYLFFVFMGAYALCICVSIGLYVQSFK